MADEKSGSFVYRAPKSDDEALDETAKPAPAPAAAPKKGVEGRVVRGTKRLFWCALIRVKTHDASLCDTLQPQIFPYLKERTGLYICTI